MNNKLLLLSGQDIPFVGAQVSIHPPSLNEISMIGEENFLIGVQFLLFDKNSLITEDKTGLENQNNFDIFMSVMNSKEIARHKTETIKVLTLLFPEYKVSIQNNKILLQLENFSSDINKNNFDEFQNLIRAIFALEEVSEKSEYNPADKLAARIAEKLKKRKQELQERKGTYTDEVEIFYKYVSILAVGLKKNMNELMNYTIYQIKDEFKRFQLKQGYDIYLKAKLAGAQDLEEVENWMG